MLLLQTPKAGKRFIRITRVVPDWETNEVMDYRGAEIVRVVRGMACQVSTG